MSPWPAGLLIVCLALSVERAATAGVTAPPPRTILFLDDDDVLYRPGTEKKVQSFAKYVGNPVLAPTKPWEETIAFVSVYRDPRSGRFQMWYQAYSDKRKEDKRLRCVVCYAVSDDGKKWTKPNLGIFPYYEDKDTNIVLIGSGGYGDRYGNSVLFDARERDPTRRYKMVYYDWATGQHETDGAGIQIAFSPDGIHWRKYEGGMVSPTPFGAKGLQPPFRGEGVYLEEQLRNGSVRRIWRQPLAMADAEDVLYDPLRDAYVIYGKMWIPGPDGGLSWKHAMGRIESKDFIHWSKPELILTTNDRDPPQVEFHTSPVFFYNGMYLSLNEILDRRAGTIDLEFMSSRDGFAWDRDFADVPVIRRGRGAVFDAGSLFSNSTPVVMGDEVWFYYGAYRGAATGGVGLDRQIIGSTDYFSGVGLASIPRDRFVAVSPNPEMSVTNPNPTSATSGVRRIVPNRRPNTIGQVTLKPLDLTGVQYLSLNVNAARGAVRVEILDEDGYRIRGFTKEDAVPMSSDGLDLKAAWKTKVIGDLPPGRYLVRVHLDRADLYAVTLH